MTDKSPKERAADTITAGLEEYDELHSCVLCAALVGSLGINKESASNYVVKAFRNGLVRRGRRREKNGYMYRLTKNHPGWGDGFLPEKQSSQKEKQQRISDVIAACKATSQVYQFDQLIRGCHG